jgi:hypothetical protein
MDIATHESQTGFEKKILTTFINPIRKVVRELGGGHRAVFAYFHDSLGGPFRFIIFDETANHLSEFQREKPFTIETRFAPSWSGVTGPSRSDSVAKKSSLFTPGRAFWISAFAGMTARNEAARKISQTASG